MSNKIDKEVVINCIDEIFGIFDNALKEELSGRYNTLDLNGARTWTQGIKAALYKKIALQDK